MRKAVVEQHRSTLVAGALIAFAVAIIVWLAIYYLLAPLPGMEEPTARLIFAINCCCVAILLCFVTGINAVAHERLNTPAINPLSGHESARMRVNLRYLQHTLEQLMLFVPGLLALSYYCPDGSSMRAVVATTVVWIIMRAAFWIGYHRAPRYRVFGAPGMLQSMLVLIYVCGRFGYDIAGSVGAAVPLAIFAGIEAYLVYVSRSPPAENGPAG